MIGSGAVPQTDGGYRMKKSFEAPVAEIIVFRTEDILSVSDDNGAGSGSGGPGLGPDEFPVA